MCEKQKTKDLERLLRQLGCVQGRTVGSHTKWTTTGGLSTSVVSHRMQSAGALRNIQKHLAAELGEGWLERGLGR
jgi:predicted RNA binding protein YcfA (HicA-like mRNA interferase family)